MRSISKKPRMVLQSVILLLVIILTMSVSYTPRTYSYTDFSGELLEEQAILTTENPVLYLSLPWLTYKVNILNLETNDTPVTIRAYESEEFLNIQNVTFIENSPLTIYSRPASDYNYEQTIRISIIRENRDVTVSITFEARVANLTTVDRVTQTIGPSPIMILAVIPLFWMLISERWCRIDKNGKEIWKLEHGALIISALVLVSSILFTPLIINMNSGNFEIMVHSNKSYETELTVEMDERIFVLNNLLEGSTSRLGFDTQNEEIGIHISHPNHTRTISWIVNESNGGANSWWLLFLENTSYHFLALRGFSNNISLDISVSSSWTESTLPQGFDENVVLAIISCVPLSIAFIMGGLIDRRYQNNM